MCLCIYAYKTNTEETILHITIPYNRDIFNVYVISILS